MKSVPPSRECRALLVPACLVLVTLPGACARTAPAASEAGAGAIACANAKLCDDFEKHALGQPPGGPWTSSISEGQTLVVDDSRPWRGSRSVHLKHTGGKSQRAYLKLGAPTLPLANNDVHGRMMFFLGTAPLRKHWDNVRGSGPLPTGGEAQYNVGGESASFLSNYEPHDCHRRTSVPFPHGRWACLQWQFNGAADGAGSTKNEMRIWLDGQEVTPATVVRFGNACVDKTMSEWHVPRFETLSIGWEQYSNTDPSEMWIDDVAVGDAPIPCPAAP